jgi:vesicle transport through interaction with t-SNAREs protein 1
VAIETEAVGTSILSDLDQQRMTLEQTRERLRRANHGLAKSKKLLQTMTKRAWANKVLMVGIIFFLVLMIVAIIYLKWIWSPRASPAAVNAPPPPSPPPAVQRRRLLWEQLGHIWALEGL